MNDFILSKITTLSNIQGNINIGKVSIEFSQNLGPVFNIVLDELTITANFIFVNGFRINGVTIGDFLRQKGINIENTFCEKMCNNNIFYSSKHA